MRKLPHCKDNKICILRSNPVNPDSRVEKEAEALVEAGYDVDIFCWDRESNHKVVKEIVHNKIPAYRYGVKASYGGGMRNLKPYLKFQLRLVSWLLKYGGKYSVIHACDFDTAFFSYIPSRFMRCRFVFDIFDYICGEPKNVMQRLVKQSENWLINHSDATIICTEQRKEQIKGTKPKKLVIIHNSPNSNNRVFDLLEEVDKNKVSVVYVGVLLDNRLLSEMVNVFKRTPNINFYIGGFGLLEDEMRDASEKYTNIHFWGKLSYDQTLSLEEECDIMTSIYDPSVENHIFAASNKFYESLMLGKPVIMVRGTGMSTYIEENDIGEIIEYTETSFEMGLRKLIERKSEWPKMSKKMKLLYNNLFNWDVMSERLIKLYKELEK